MGKTGLKGIFLAIGMILLGWNISFASDFTVRFENREEVGTKGGIVSNEAKFVEGKEGGGILCKFSPETVGTDFCKFPTEGRINKERGTIQLWIKPLWGPEDKKSRCFFNVGSSVLYGDKNTFHLQKEGDDLSFVVLDEQPREGGKYIHFVKAYKIFSGWKTNEWHHIAVTWDVNSGLGIYVDGFKEGFCSTKLSLGNLPEWMYVGNNHITDNGEKYYFPSDAVIAELQISDSVIEKFGEIKNLPLKTAVWPSDWGRGGKVYLVKGIPIHQQFYYYGDSAKIKEANLVIEIPEGIKLEGVYQAKRDDVFLKKPPLDSAKIKREDRDYVRYTIPILETSTIGPSLADTINHGVYLEPEPNFNTGEYNIYWHLSVNQKEGEERVIKTIVLPELEKLPKPKNFPISLFFYGSLIEGGGGGLFRYHPDDDRLIGDTIREACKEVNVQFGIPGKKGGVGDFVLDHADWFQYGGWAYSGKIGHPRIGKDKNPLEGLACPTYIISKGIQADPDVLSSLKERLKGVSRELFDYELGGGGTECFCKDCLNSFAQKAGLSPEGLTPGIILAKYRNDWARFQCYQNGEIARILCEMVKKSNPETKVLFCASYLFPEDYMLITGEDVRRYDPFVDVHMPMMYFTGLQFYQEVEKTIKALAKPVMPYLCAVDFVFNSPPIYSSPQEFRMNMLAAATSGAKGIAIYPGLESLDGEYYRMLNETMSEIALLEDIFSRGERKDKFIRVKRLPGGDLPYKVIYRNGKYLVALFNYDKNKPAFLEITAPDISNGRYSLYDPISKKALFPGNNASYWTEQELKKGLTYSIPPEEVKFLFLEPFNQKQEWKGSLAQNVIREAYEESQALLDRKELVGDNLKIGWEDVDHNGSLEIKVESPLQKIYINNEEGARLWGWEIKGKELVNKRNLSNDGLGMDMFYPLPGWGGEQAEIYEIVKKEIKDNKAVISLRRKLEKSELKGLVIEKTYTISSVSSGIKINYRVTNSAKRQLNFSFWSHNSPQLNKEPWVLVVPTEKEIRLVSNESGLDVIYNVKNAERMQGWEEGARKGEISEGWVSAYAPKTKEAIAVQLDFSKLFQIYSWRGSPPTLEWMYKECSLKPGDTWETDFTLIYLEKTEPKSIKEELKKQVICGQAIPRIPLSVSRKILHRLG